MSCNNLIINNKKNWREFEKTRIKVKLTAFVEHTGHIDSTVVAVQLVVMVEDGVVELERVVVAVVVVGVVDQLARRHIVVEVVE